MSKYISPEQMDYLLGQLIGRMNSTYAKSTTVSAEIGLTADGSGYEITLPWFKIENGLIKSEPHTRDFSRELGEQIVSVCRNVYVDTD